MASPSPAAMPPAPQGSPPAPAVSSAIELPKWETGWIPKAVKHPASPAGSDPAQALTRAARREHRQPPPPFPVPAAPTGQGETTREAAEPQRPRVQPRLPERSRARLSVPAVYLFKGFTGTVLTAS